MIEESGKIVAADSEAGSVWVETQRQAACDTCSAKSGCGHSTLAKLGRNTVHLEADCHIDVAVGDYVVVGIPEQVMLKSSLLAYLMPLLWMLGAILLAEQIWARDLVSAVAGMAGLAAGFALLRWHFHKNQHDQRYRPVVLRLLHGGDSIRPDTVPEPQNS